MAGRSENARHWPVVAWIRLRLPEIPPPLQLTAGPPPPPRPPLDLLESEPVPTDPNVRIYTFEEALPAGGRMRIVWQSADPGALIAEYRRPRLVARVDPSELRAFWSALKLRVGELGALAIEAADPRP